MPKKKTDDSFEEKLKQLESIVAELDSDEVSLQESLTKFESGVSIYKECQEFLVDAQKKVKVLTDSLKLEDYNQE